MAIYQEIANPILRMNKKYRIGGKKGVINVIKLGIQQKDVIQALLAEVVVMSKKRRLSKQALVFGIWNNLTRPCQCPIAI